MPNPEAELRALWTEQGVPQERQDELIAETKGKAAPGAPVGPFRIPFRVGETVEIRGATGIVQERVPQSPVDHYVVRVGEARFLVHPDEMALAAEQTAEGIQTLAPGVAPVSTRERLEAQQRAPKRGRNAPCDDGLFDLGERNQGDLFG